MKNINFLNLMAKLHNEDNYWWYRCIKYEASYKCNICDLLLPHSEAIYQHGEWHVKNSKLKCFI